MTGSDIALILTAVGVLVTALCSGIAVVIAAKAAAALTRVKETVDVIKVATDGMKSDLVAVTERAARAEGHAEGRAEQKAEVAADAVVVGEVAEIPVHAKKEGSKPETSKPAAPKAAKKS